MLERQSESNHLPSPGQNRLHLQWNEQRVLGSRAISTRRFLAKHEQDLITLVVWAHSAGHFISANVWVHDAREKVLGDRVFDPYKYDADHTLFTLARDTGTGIPVELVEDKAYWAETKVIGPIALMAVVLANGYGQLNTLPDGQRS